MTRRDLLVGVSAVVMAGVVPVHIHSHRYGYMDVDRWFAEGLSGARVLCDGVDITNLCEWFDDVKGEAGCLVTTPHLKREVLRGRIEVVP